VRSLLPLDKTEAFQLAHAISLDIPPTECSSILVPDTSDYYSNVAAIANEELTSGQKPREQYLRWLWEDIRAMNSATEIAPMAAALLNLHTSANEFQQLVDAYSLRLAELKATDREMAVLQSDQSLVSAMRRLADRLQGTSWPVAPLMRSYGSFLERSAHAPRCSDPPTVWMPVDWNHVTQDFKKLSLDFGLGGHANADFVSIRRSAEKGGVAEVHILPDPGELFAVLGKLQASKRTQQGKTGTPDGHEIMGWESDLVNILSKIDAIDPSSTPCYACTFSEKASLLLLYLDSTPPGEWKEKVLTQLMQLLTDRIAERDAPLDWLTRMHAVLNMARRPSPEDAERLKELERTGKAPNLFPSELGPQILQLMKASRNQTMYLYATADEVFGNAYVIPPHPN